MATGSTNIRSFPRKREPRSQVPWGAVHLRSPSSPPHRNDIWVPAFAGMTGWGWFGSRLMPPRGRRLGERLHVLGGDDILVAVTKLFQPTATYATPR